MSEPDWLGPAQDRLHEVGLDEAAAALERHERLVAFLEDTVRRNGRFSAGWGDSALPLIAEARGETPEQAIARLTPQSPQSPMHWNAVRNPYQDAIDVMPLVERELSLKRQQVEDFLRDNNADPATHEHVIYPDLASPMGGRIHVLMPKADVPAGDRALPVEQAMIRYPHMRSRF